MKIHLLDCARENWWRNFWMSDPYKNSELEKVNAALKKYNAKITNAGSIFGALEFDTEQDYVMFVLRW